MSFVKKSECHKCGTNLQHVGINAFEVVPTPHATDSKVSRETQMEQLQLARDTQASMAPHLLEMTCGKEAGSYVSTPPAMGSLSDLPQIMSDANLTVRVTNMLDGVDEQARCAEVTAANLSELFETGSLSVAAPRGGAFHLKSNAKHQLTQLSYTTA